MQMNVLLLVGVLYAPGCLANRSSTIKDAVAKHWISVNLEAHLPTFTQIDPNPLPDSLVL
ncbi:hypothetical protein DPMN_101174 [Dreissena polymorpha]|uniref:Uncharacterized protein n=1 Tax=Dreissena polymorpha TaxID=45954 RepID=A0A9D4LH76_DREPO|nr:hypothetical protein DPMN_101174 [Dreissena polymorpha]